MKTKTVALPLVTVLLLAPLAALHAADAPIQNPKSRIKHPFGVPLLAGCSGEREPTEGKPRASASSKPAAPCNTASATLAIDSSVAPGVWPLSWRNRTGGNQEFFRPVYCDNSGPSGFG